jgi:hypothetical protein
VDRFVDRVREAMYRAAMPHTPSGRVEQLPGGSWRARVYGGKGSLTGREIRFRKTCKTDRDAQIELGKLLALAQAGRQPDSDVTVALLLDQYMRTAGWDLSIRGKQPRVHPADHQASPWAHAWARGPGPSAWDLSVN